MVSSNYQQFFSPSSIGMVGFCSFNVSTLFHNERRFFCEYFTNFISPNSMYLIKFQLCFCVHATTWILFPNFLHQFDMVTNTKCDLLVFSWTPFKIIYNQKQYIFYVQRFSLQNRFQIMLFNYKYLTDELLKFVVNLDYILLSWYVRYVKYKSVKSSFI